MTGKSQAARGNARFQKHDGLSLCSLAITLRGALSYAADLPHSSLMNPLTGILGCQLVNSETMPACPCNMLLTTVLYAPKVFQPTFASSAAAAPTRMPA